MTEQSNRNNNNNNSHNILNKVSFRTVRPTDIPACASLEKASYPADEAASKSTLQYRQHHAARYFRCATVREVENNNDDDEDEDDEDEPVNVEQHVDDDDDDEHETIIGFICSTRCNEPFQEDSMSTHVSDGPLLAIHSVVMREDYRHRGIATAMLQNYVAEIEKYQQAESNEINNNETTPPMIEKIVLIAKKELLAFYLNCGFQAMGPSSIVHGKDVWYDMQMDLLQQQQDARQNAVPCFMVNAFCDPNNNSNNKSSSLLSTGNPAAVVMLQEETDLSDQSTTLQWMQQVAAEFNLSETAFLVPMEVDDDDNNSNNNNGKDDKDNKELHYQIRYFTPTVQVPLCGHATLASAAIVYQTTTSRHRTSSSRTTVPVVFHALQDVVLTAQLASSCSRQQEQGRYQISMEFPQKAPQEIVNDEDRRAVEKMLQSAFSSSKVIDSQSILYMGLCSSIGDLLVQVTYESFVQIGGGYSDDGNGNNSSESITFEAFLEWDGYHRGVIICCACPPPSPHPDTTTTNNNSKNEAPETQDEQQKKKKQEEEEDGGTSIDFLSRFFAPKAGINEDPVTGSAHCVLAPYFGAKLGKEHLVGRQMSRRGGIVECLLLNDSNNVKLTGLAVTVMNGTLEL